MSGYGPTGASGPGNLPTTVGPYGPVADTYGDLPVGAYSQGGIVGASPVNLPKVVGPYGPWDPGQFLSFPLLSCACTNQCRSCGACCAVGCSHRPGRNTVTVTTTGTAPTAVTPPATLTEQRVREIVREEIRASLRNLARRISTRARGLR